MYSPRFLSGHWSLNPDLHNVKQTFYPLSQCATPVRFFSTWHNCREPQSPRVRFVCLPEGVMTGSLKAILGMPWDTGGILTGTQKENAELAAAAESGPQMFSLAQLMFSKN